MNWQKITSDNQPAEGFEYLFWQAHPSHSGRYIDGYMDKGEVWINRSVEAPYELSKFSHFCEVKPPDFYLDWKIESIETDQVADDSPDVSYLEFDENMTAEENEANRERLEKFNRGDWQMLGLAGMVKISTDFGRRTETITDSLGGVESDANQDYYEDIFESSLAEIKVQLIEEYNIKEADIDRAVFSTAGWENHQTWLNDQKEAEEKTHVDATK